MKRISLIALGWTLAVATPAVAQSDQENAQRGTAPDSAVEWDRDCPHPDTVRDGGFSWLRSGTLEPRECVLAGIVEWRRELSYTEHTPDAVFRGTLSWSEQLLRHYELRADRQQRIMDVESAVSFTGALGAGLSGRVGAATQRAWLGASFFPLLLMQQNNNEPTRDIYHAGAIGLAQINQRYETLFRIVAVSSVEEQTATTTVTQSPTTAANQLPHCSPPAPDSTETTLAGIVAEVSQWPASDRGAILPEAQRLLRACESLRSASNQIDIVDSNVQALQREWARYYADDVLELDAALLERDRDFRSTPFESIRLMTGAPFRALDNFLTGENTTAALDALKVANAFSGLSRTLSPITLPPAPRTVEPIEPLSAAAWARLSTTERPSAEANQRYANQAQPLSQRVPEVVITLDRLATQLRSAQDWHNYRAGELAQLRQAAASNHLKFEFSTASRTVNVTLAPPPPPPPSPPTQTAN